MREFQLYIAGLMNVWENVTLVTVGAIFAERACGADSGKFGTVGVTFAELACEADLRAIVTLVTLVTVNFELYIAGLMGLYGKGDVLATGEKRGMMSIGFCFLSFKSEGVQHAYPLPQENRNHYWW
jgi:hypothetical protein